MVLFNLLNIPRGTGSAFLSQRQNQGPVGHVETQKREVGHVARCYMEKLHAWTVKTSDPATQNELSNQDSPLLERVVLLRKGTGLSCSE